MPRVPKFRPSQRVSTPSGQQFTSPGAARTEGDTLARFAGATLQAGARIANVNQRQNRAQAALQSATARSRIDALNQDALADTNLADIDDPRERPGLYTQTFNDSIVDVIDAVPKSQRENIKAYAANVSSRFERGYREQAQVQFFNKLQDGTEEFIKNDMLTLRDNPELFGDKLISSMELIDTLDSELQLRKSDRKKLETTTRRMAIDNAVKGFQGAGQHQKAQDFLESHSDAFSLQEFDKKIDEAKQVQVQEMSHNSKLAALEERNQDAERKEIQRQNANFIAIAEVNAKTPEQRKAVNDWKVSLAAANKIKIADVARFSRFLGETKLEDRLSSEASYINRITTGSEPFERIREDVEQDMVVDNAQKIRLYKYLRTSSQQRAGNGRAWADSNKLIDNAFGTKEFLDTLLGNSSKKKLKNQAIMRKAQLTEELGDPRQAALQTISELKGPAFNAPIIPGLDLSRQRTPRDVEAYMALQKKIFQNNPNMTQDQLESLERNMEAAQERLNLLNLDQSIKEGLREQKKKQKGTK